MKKVCIGVLIAIVAITLGGSLFRGLRPKEVDFVIPQGISYSNLADEISKAAVLQLLSDHGIERESNKNFMGLVEKYNQQFPSIPTAKEGFVLSSTMNIAYDTGKAGEIWKEATDSRYSDINCRLASFSLLQNWFITPKENYTGDTLNLMFDLDAIQKHNLTFFSKEDLEHYKFAFAQMIPKETITDKNVMHSFIRKTWQERGVSFPQEDGISFVSVFIHDVTFGEVFIGHCGVLVTLPQGYVFIEKLAPTLPYQVTTFQNKEELIACFDARYGNRFDEQGTRPVYMENMELLNP